MAWTSPVDFIANTQLNAEQLNLIQDNLRALKNPPSEQLLRNNTVAYTTNSNTWVYIDYTNLKITLDTKGGDVLLWFHGYFTIGVTATLYLDCQIDGDDMIAFGQGFMGLVAHRFSSPPEHVGWTAMVKGLPVGSHTFWPTWYVSNGTATLYSNAGSGVADLPVVFGAREIT